MMSLKTNDFKLKKCPKCKTLMPRSMFSANKTKYDGLQSECKSCRVSMERQRLLRKKQLASDDPNKSLFQALTRIDDMLKNWHLCNKCLELKTLDKFYKAVPQHKYPKGVFDICIDCCDRDAMARYSYKGIKTGTRESLAKKDFNHYSNYFYQDKNQ